MRTSFQLPVICLGSSDKKMCLFISKYLNNRQFHACVGEGGGRGQVALNLKGIQILNAM